MKHSRNWSAMYNCVVPLNSSKTDDLFDIFVMFLLKDKGFLRVAIE